MAGIGGLGMATIVGVQVLCYFAGSPIDFQTDIFGRWVVGGMLFFCLVSVVATVPRVWDVVVDGDEITVINLFVFRRKYRISDITHCVKTTGSIRVYVKGKKRTAFLVDAMNDGVDNFIKRMEKENVQIIDKVKKPVE